MEDESVNHTRKKSKTKRKLRVFRILTAVFAVLFAAASAFAAASVVKASSERDSLRQSITEMRENVNALTTGNASLTAQIQSLTGEKEDLSAKLFAASGSSAESQNTIETLMQQIEALSAEKLAKEEELGKEISSLTSRLDTAKSANNVLTSRNDELSSKISSLNSQISSLEKQKAELVEAISSLGGVVPEPEEPEAEETGKKDEPAPVSEKIAYLTFDDGVSKYTDTILDTLAEYNVKATFFPNWKSGNDEKYRRIVNEGHAIGNHTYSHEYDDVYTTADGFRSEITKLNDKIASVTGYSPEIFRFPGGSNNTVYKKRNPEIMDQAFGIIDSLGMEYYDWNVNSGDADSSKGASKNEIVTNVLNRATMDKAVILMHDTNTKGTTVQALPEIIEGLMAKGYTFSVLTDGSAPVIHSREPKN